MSPVAKAPVHDILGRVRSEFLEMPGLKLTVAQAQRLWGLDRSTCETLIDRLIESHFLRRTHDGAVMLGAAR
jgi:hypothetical protein